MSKKALNEMTLEERILRTKIRRIKLREKRKLARLKENHDLHNQNQRDERQGTS